MWWAIVTLGTVGYGDVVPVTPLGKLVSVFAIVGGLAMIALPVAIISTAFADEIRRRDFVVTWGMLARVPLFSHLSATEIADIMRLLQARTIEGGEILRRPAGRGPGPNARRGPAGGRRGPREGPPRRGGNRRAQARHPAGKRIAPPGGSLSPMWRGRGTALTAPRRKPAKPGVRQPKHP